MRVLSLGPARNPGTPGMSVQALIVAEPSEAEVLAIISEQIKTAPAKGMTFEVIPLDQDRLIISLSYNTDDEAAYGHAVLTINTLIAAQLGAQPEIVLPEELQFYGVVRGTSKLTSLGYKRDPVQIAVLVENGSEPPPLYLALIGPHGLTGRVFEYANGALLLLEELKGDRITLEMPVGKVIGVLKRILFPDR